MANISINITKDENGNIKLNTTGVAEDGTDIDRSINDISTISVIPKSVLNNVKKEKDE